MRVRILLAALTTFIVHLQGGAWVYPEHRRIGILAIGRLSSEEKKLFDMIWAEARKGHEQRLSEMLADEAQGRFPTHLDFASWMAIAGDHSRSPNDMLHNILYTKWILEVADIAAHLSQDLKVALNSSQHTNAMRKSDLNLLRADEDYATRAGKNNVHFLLARNKATQSFANYLSYCVNDSVELNAINAYVWFHSLALKKISNYNKEGVSSEQKSKLALAALADEAFALHFLQNMFSAGHAAGTWGNASMRKGTHDHYNEKGIEVVTWEGDRLTLMGDAFMRKEDADIASKIVAQSLSQFIQSLNSQPEGDVSLLPDTLDVGMAKVIPQKDISEKIKSILAKTPVPGLGSGIGELPRFRSELGPFIGVSTSVTMTNVNRGFGQLENTPGVIAGIDGNIRFGYGLDGVTNKSGDGLIFLQLGWREDSNSSNQVTGKSTNSISLTSAIPARDAFNMRLRVPFWLVPGDLLLAAPVLAIAAPKKLTKMVANSVNGGVIPWQSGIATPIGRFQFVLGREVGVSLYGYGATSDSFIVTDAQDNTYFVRYQSTKFEFPILEYRLVRSFAFDQASTFYMQFSFGVDVPHKTRIVSGPPGSDISLQPVWFFTTSLIFNWRHYF